MKRYTWRLALLLILVLMMAFGSGCTDGQAVPDSGGLQQQEESTGSNPDDQSQEDSNGTSSAEAPKDGAVEDETGANVPEEGSSSENMTGAVPGGASGGSGATGTVAAEKASVRISVNASTILDNLDAFDQAKREILPENGMILEPVEVEIEQGDTVFDVLLKVTKDKRVHMEFVSTPLYKSNYIEGIGNIYEIDAGPLSGWMYKVNGIFPNYGCGKYAVQPGDLVEWVYTCDLGRDVGGDWNAQNN